MAPRKLYAGLKLREVRRTAELTQRDFAGRLGVSLSYLNQMENNHRPVAAQVILSLAREFAIDVTELGAEGAERVVSDMAEALADPVFAATPVPDADLHLTASNAPSLARAFLALHRAHRQLSEELGSLNEALGTEGSALAPLPWEEVRDFFHYCDNYVDAVDRAAERFGESFMGPDRLRQLAERLQTDHNITVTITMGGPVRQYDPGTRTLTVAAEAGAATQIFQIAHQLALLAHDDLLEATLDLARFRSPAARQICKTGLANYFAGAALLPYAQFLSAAQECRHDLEVLALRFTASIEQVAHRLSTLQRPGAKGVPFFFVRVDQAGTITKRHSATRLQFARFGGACPLWNVHRAFEVPGRFLRQLAETPDGVRYVCLARDVTKPGLGFRAPTRRYAIGLGCELAHAGALVYADDLDPGNNAAFAPIGVSCRICPRTDCHQRSVPPMDRVIHIDPNTRGMLPYGLRAAPNSR